MLKTICNLLILTVLLGSTAVSAGKIIKWVDKNGVTHYGDKPPMPSKAKRSTELNDQGVKVREIDSRPVQVNVGSEQREQSRYDKALLATYNSVEEIDLAKERNTRIDKLALKALEQKRERISNRLAQNNKSLLELAKADKKPSQDMLIEVERDTDALEKIEAQIAARKDAIASINDRYDKDKTRYTLLQDRKSQLYNIKYAKKSIEELREWRADALSRLDKLHEKSRQYKRRGHGLPNILKAQLLDTTNELDRVNKEIRAKELAINESKTELSK